MRKMNLLFAAITLSGILTAQNVGIGTSSPAEKLEVNGKTKTSNFQMTNGATIGYVLQSDANGNATWAPPSFSGANGGGCIPFSTGSGLNGPFVTSSSPVLMGFGNYAIQTIDGSGESTMPPQAGGFVFTVPFTGTIQHLQISADLLVASVSIINIIPLVYEFTVYRASSTPNNGTSHISSTYTTTPFSSSLTFGGPGNSVIPGTFYSATNINTGSIAVSAGDRIGVRVRTTQFSDPAASDITQLAFSASLFYTY